MDLNQWKRVRYRVIVECVSKRAVMRAEGLHWDTLQRMLNNEAPPGYQREAGSKPGKLDEHIPWLEEVLRTDQSYPRKQRHTIKRLHERLRDEKGYTGCYTMVRECVNGITKRTKEVYMPLSHRPGEAQVDFGHALVKVAGKLGKYPFFVMSLPYSDAFYIQVFPRECTETFQEGHVRAFNWLGKVPHRISYDNSRIAVSKIMGGRERRLTDGFLRLQSHYLYGEHFCRVARGNEKGVVEGIVKYGRSNFMVPVPQVSSLEVLNKTLEAQCLRDLQRRLRGQEKRKQELLEEEKAVMRELPEVPFEACRSVSTMATSLSLVRFESNDYSVPVEYAHHPAWIKGFTNEVLIYNRGKQVARHDRIWEKERISFDPIHYLALLARKPGALDHARPLEGWKLPECFGILRAKLEERYSDEGSREYISVLRLLENHSMTAVRQAIASALRHGALKRDAIAQYLYPQEDYGSTLFRLDGHAHLRHVKVQAADVSAYNILLKKEVF